MKTRNHLLKFTLASALLFMAFCPFSFAQQGTSNTIVFKNRFRAENFIKVQNGQVAGGTLKGHLNSGVWIKELVDANFFRLRKAGTKDQYLHTERGVLESSSVPFGYWTSHWKLMHVSGTNFYRIENRFRKGKFLNVEKGSLEASNVPAGYWTSHWEMMGKEDIVKLYPNEPMEPYPDNVSSSTQTLNQGRRFFKLINGQWTQITTQQEIRDMINNPILPNGNNLDHYEDWYFMYLDASKDYYFNASGNKFDPKIGHASQFTTNYGRSANWFIPNARINSRKAVLLSRYNQENEVFRTESGTGYQWIVVSSRHRKQGGTYKFTYSDYGDGYNKNDGRYGEMSKVAFSKIGNLSSGATNLYLNFDGFNRSNFRRILVRSDNGDFVRRSQVRLNNGTIDTVRMKNYWAFIADSYLQSSTVPGAKYRDAVIQHILFKTAEIFSPFNVAVTRRAGNSSFGNDQYSTTVFIGDDRNATDSYGVQHPSFKNLDFGNKKLDLGWVDYFNNAKRKEVSLNQIIQWIAHEAGHAYGLKHIRSSGSDIPPGPNGTPQSFSSWKDSEFNNAQCLGRWNGPGSKPEVMSYNSTNSIFEDHAFDLTGWNNDKRNRNNNGCGDSLSHRGSGFPVWEGTTITKQNSYRYLKYVLGSGRFGETSNVADREAVMQYDVRNAVYLYTKENYRSQAARGKHGIYDDKDRALLKDVSDEKIREVIRNNPNIVNTKVRLRDDNPYKVNFARHFADNIDRLGDYDVYLFKPNNDWLIKDISCIPIEAEKLDPILMIYDETGKNLLAYDDNSGEGNSSLINYNFENGKTYKLVIGANDNISKGGYYITVYPYNEVKGTDTYEVNPPGIFYVDNNHDKIETTEKEFSNVPDQVKFTLSTAEEIGKYKSMKIFGRHDVLSWEIKLDVNDHGPKEMVIPTAMLGDTFKIEFIKAKAFDVHTGVGTITYKKANVNNKEINFHWVNE